MNFGQDDEIVNQSNSFGQGDEVVSNNYPVIDPEKTPQAQKIATEMQLPIEAVHQNYEPLKWLSDQTKDFGSYTAGVGESMAAEFNLAMGHVGHKLSLIAEWAGKKGGIVPPEDAQAPAGSWQASWNQKMIDWFGKRPFGADKWQEAADRYNANAKYWQEKASTHPSDFLSEVLGATGGAPVGIAEFGLNIPYAAVSGAATAEEQGKDEFSNMLVEAGKRGVLGKIFDSMASLRKTLSVPAMATVFSGQSLLEGSTPREAVKQGAVGAILAGTTPGEGTIGIRDVISKSPEARLATPEAVESTKGLKKGTLAVPTTEQLVAPIKKGLEVLKDVSNVALKAGIEPSKVVEKELGGQAYTDIYRGTRGRISRSITEFGGKELEKVDNTIDGLSDWFTSKGTDKDLENFMVAYRGKPTSKEAIKLSESAKNSLPQDFKDPKVIQAVQEIADLNYVEGKRVAIEMGKDLGYFKDYFYGQWNDGTQTVQSFLDHWKTTKRWTEEKALPSPADALAYGIKLRNPNPVSNLRAERIAIARMDGAIWERNQAYENGKDIYIAQDTPENRAKYPNWVKLDDSVFKEDIVNPTYAEMHNNLIASNAVMANPVLSKLRATAGFMRYWRLWIPAFHGLNVEKGQIKEMGIMGVRSGETGSLAAIARKMGKDPVRSVENPMYLDWVEHGLEHRSSSEYEAMTQVTRTFDSVAKIFIDAKAVDAIKNVNVLGKYRTWLFDEHIPNIKFASVLAKQAVMERQLGRPLTSPEKVNIVKETQNIYGEMNEALFGRSGTMTSVLRLFYTAPGYSEGNFRTIYDATMHWKGGRGTNMRYFIPLSFALMAGVAATGTRIFTGQWPPIPKTKDELRDYFKIKLGVKDDKGRDTYLDTLTYEKDYWSVFANLLEPQEAVKALAQRSVGMTGGTTQVASDLLDIVAGKAVYVYDGNQVMPIYEPALQKAMKLAIYELKRIQPISVSVFKQARQQKASLAIAAVESIMGARPSLTEAEKKKAENVKQLFQFKDDTEKLYRFIGTMDDPQSALKEYESNAEHIVSMFPKTEQNRIRMQLKIEQFKNIQKALASKAMSQYSPEAKAKAIKQILETIK